MPIAFSEKDAGRRENLRGFSWSVVVWEPVMLPLLFLPKPKDIERRESMDCLGVSCCPTPPVMLTGGYFLGFSSDFSAFRFPPNIELVLLKIPPIVFDLLWPCPFDSYAFAPSNPVTLANFGGT
jgi:hypothetical protein